MPRGSAESALLPPDSARPGSNAQRRSQTTATAQHPALETRQRDSPRERPLTPQHPRPTALLGAPGPGLAVLATQTRASRARPPAPPVPSEMDGLMVGRTHRIPAKPGAQTPDRTLRGLASPGSSLSLGAELGAGGGQGGRVKSKWKKGWKPNGCFQIKSWTKGKGADEVSEKYKQNSCGGEGAEAQLKASCRQGKGKRRWEKRPGNSPDLPAPRTSPEEQDLSPGQHPHGPRPARPSQRQPTLRRATLRPIPCTSPAEHPSGSQASRTRAGARHGADATRKSPGRRPSGAAPAAEQRQPAETCRALAISVSSDVLGGNGAETHSRSPEALATTALWFEEETPAAGTELFAVRCRGDSGPVTRPPSQHSQASCYFHPLSPHGTKPDPRHSNGDHPAPPARDTARLLHPTTSPRKHPRGTGWLLSHPPCPGLRPPAPRSGGRSLRGLLLHLGSEKVKRPCHQRPAAGPTEQSSDDAPRCFQTWRHLPTGTS